MTPESMFLLAIALKMAMIATLVVAASVAVERAGPFIGALIASLPTSAGAAYIILAIEHEPAFVAQSAVGSLAANAPTAMFAMTYSVLARKRPLVVSIGGAVIVWLGFAFIIRPIEWTVWTALLLCLVAYAVTVYLTRPYRAVSPPKAGMKPRRFDIPLRALTVAVFVAAVTTLSSRIGSFASGMFAVFPVAMGSFMVILHSRIGGPAAANVLAHIQPPLIGFALGFLPVHFGAERLGVWWALLAGLSVCVAWNAMLWLMRERAKRHSAA